MYAPVFQFHLLCDPLFNWIDILDKFERFSSPVVSHVGLMTH